MELLQPCLFTGRLQDPWIADETIISCHRIKPFFICIRISKNISVVSAFMAAGIAAGTGMACALVFPSEVMSMPWRERSTTVQ